METNSPSLRDTQGDSHRTTAGAVKERERQQKRIDKLEEERRRLVRAHLEGAIPVDILKEEQKRLTVELSAAEGQLRATEIDWDNIEANLTYAMGLTSDCMQAYRRGSGRVRRNYNQAFFEAIYLDIGGVEHVTLAQPFTHVLPPDIRDSVEEKKNPDPHVGDRGLSKNRLVGAEGLEPPTPSL